MERNDIIKIIAGASLVFGLIWLTVAEFPYFSNTADFFSVLWKGGAIWIPFAILASVFLTRILGYPWYNGLLIGLTIGVFSFPLASSWMNRLGMKDQMYTEDLTFLGVDARIKDRGVRQVGPVPEPDEYHIFLGNEDDPLRLIVDPSPFWLTLEPGQSVKVRWIPGRLGGRVFEEVVMDSAAR